MTARNGRPEGRLDLRGRSSYTAVDGGHFTTGNLKSVYLSGGTHWDCTCEYVRLINERIMDARFSNRAFSGSLT